MSLPCLFSPCSPCGFGREWERKNSRGERKPAGGKRALVRLQQLEETIREIESRERDLSDQVERLDREHTRALRDRDRLWKDTESLRETVKARLTSLYKFRQTGYLSLLFNVDETSEMFRCAHATVDLLQYDHRALLALRNAVLELQRLESVLSHNWEAMETLKVKTAAMEGELNSARKEKVMLTELIRVRLVCRRPEPGDGPGAQGKSGFIRKAILEKAARPFSSLQGGLRFQPSRDN